MRGTINLALIALIIAGILLSAVWKPGVSFSIFGTTLELQNLARDGALDRHRARSRCGSRRDEHRAANGFTWEPIREVAKLFAAHLRRDLAGAGDAAGRTRRAVRVPALGGDRK